MDLVPGVLLPSLLVEVSEVDPKGDPSRSPYTTTLGCRPNSVQVLRITNPYPLSLPTITYLGV